MHTCSFHGVITAVLATAGVLPCLTNVHADSVRDNAAFTGFQLLEDPVNPVQIGMGSAGTAAPGRGFSYYNPALPLLQGVPYLSVEYGQYPAADLGRAHFETAWPFQKWFLGASLHTESIDGIVPVSFDGKVSTDPSAQFSAQTTNVALGAGFLAASGLSMGLCLNGAQERIAEYRGYALSVSGGVAWAAIPGKLSFGLAAFHAGTTTSMLDTTMNFGQGARLPSSARAGAAWIDTIASVGYTACADVVFRNADLRFMVPVGLEVRPVPPLALRIGKRFNDDTGLLSMGCGITLAPLSCDVAFVIPKLVDDAQFTWLVGITYTLGASHASLGRTKVNFTEKETPVVKPVQEQPGQAKQPVAAPVVPAGSLSESKETPVTAAPQQSDTAALKPAPAQPATTPAVVSPPSPSAILPANTQPAAAPDSSAAHSPNQ